MNGGTHVRGHRTMVLIGCQSHIASSGNPKQVCYESLCWHS